MMAWISPAFTAIDTSRSASTAPKRRPSDVARSTMSHDGAVAMDVISPKSIRRGLSAISAESDIETAFPCDQEFLDLGAAVADGADAIVAIVARHRALLHIAEAAMHLNREIGALAAGLAGVILRHRQFLEIVAALIDAPCRAIGEEPRRIDLKRDVGDHLLNELKPAERAAKGLALLGPLDGVIERGLREAKRTGGEEQPRGLVALVQNVAPLVR